MPSETLSRALRVLEPRAALYRESVAAAVDEVRGLLGRARVPAEGSARRIAGELGAFATGRIDADRFARFFSGGDTLDDVSLDRIEAAAETLGEVLEWGVELHHVEVQPDGDLRSAVRSALAVAGRAFAAARAAEAARTGRYRTGEHDVFIHGFPASRWTRAERLTAPPLVVEVSGADLQASSLAEVLDGAMKIVLLVRGEAPPAPLVRLITPGVWVAQLGGIEELEALPGLIEDDAPAVAAVMPPGSARFIHRPGGGPIEVQHLPGEAPRKALGSYGAFQQLEELRQLAALAAVAASAAARETATVAAAGGNGHGAPVAATPADKLAAWLLKQARLPEPS